MSGPVKKMRKGSQSSGSLRARPIQMDPIIFMDTSDSIQVSYPNRWAPMYDYIEQITKSTELPLKVIRDNDGRKLDEELYNEELLRL